MELLVEGRPLPARSAATRRADLSRWRPGPRTGHKRRHRPGSRGQPVIASRRSATTATTVPRRPSWPCV